MMHKTCMVAALAALLIAAPALSPGASAQYAQPAAPAETAKPKADKKPTPAQAAAAERQKKCAAEWKDAKAAGKVEKSMTWPKYWSACNKRLKAAS